MIGIIYKFTIVCGKVKKRNKCPFYIGQHWERISVENFIHKKGKCYYSGSGCNVLHGTANGFGSGSPMKDPIVAKRMSKSMKNFYKTKKG